MSRRRRSDRKRNILPQVGKRGVDQTRSSIPNMKRDNEDPVPDFWTAITEQDILESAVALLLIEIVLYSHQSLPLKAVGFR